MGLKVFAGSASQILATRICQHLKIPLAKSQTIKFGEGNIFVRVRENVRGQDTFIVQTTSEPVNDNFMELLFWIDALKRASAAQVTAVIPFFSYAKGDKKDEPRVSIRARVCADCIEAAGADRVLTMDLHAAQIQGFFRIPVDHLYAMPVLANHIRRRRLKNLCIVSPDIGFGKMARKYADLLKADVAIGDKERLNHNEQAIMYHVIGDVKDKNVFIVDDMVLSGGTMIEIADQLKQLGARHIYAAATHGVFSNRCVERLEKSPIEEMVVTDTVPNGERLNSSRIRCVSVAKLFADAIRIIHERRSMSRLFKRESMA